MNRWPKIALVWKPRITVSDATQRRLQENLRDLWDVPEETPLINLPVDVPEICKSTLFEMSLRHCMRRLIDASEMHPCWLGSFRIVSGMKHHEIRWNYGILRSGKCNFLLYFQKSSTWSHSLGHGSWYESNEWMKIFNLLWIKYKVAASK